MLARKELFWVSTVAVKWPSLVLSERISFTLISLFPHRETEFLFHDGSICLLRGIDFLVESHSEWHPVVEQQVGIVPDDLSKQKNRTNHFTKSKTRNFKFFHVYFSSNLLQVAQKPAIFQIQINTS